MSPRRSWSTALVLAFLVTPIASMAANAAAAAPKSAAPAKKATATAQPPRPATTASDAKATAPAPAAKATAPATGASETQVPAGPADATARSRAAGPRTLEDIHIEGEIPVPQVLFITTRDQRRFVGFQHRRYQRTSRKIGEETAVPSRILVTGAATLPERSHSDE